MINWIKSLFVVSETNSNAPEADYNDVAESNILNHDANAEHVEVNQSILDYFKGLTLKEYRPDFLYHGGEHDPSIPVKGALWFYLEKDMHIAESYMNWGSSGNPKLKKTLLKAKPVKTLKLLEFPGNHVEILKNIYGKPWNHAQLAKDVTTIGEPNILGIDGFYRPRTDEYFIINVQDNLIFTSKP